MTPELYLRLVIEPGLTWLGERYATPPAKLLLLAIAAQESRLQHRKQIVGPARSYWQIEPPTAALVVSKWPVAAARLAELGIEVGYLERTARNNQPLDYCSRVLEFCDLAALVIARGILWLEPRPLPELGDEAGAWTYYAERCWRPGKPHPELWPASYRQACGACGVGMV